MLSLVIIVLLLSVPYVYYACKLQNHLEKHHQDKIDKLGLPKKVKLGFYYHTPKTQFNALKFIFSKEDFGDTQLRYYKIAVRITSIILLVGWLILVLAMLF